MRSHVWAVQSGTAGFRMWGYDRQCYVALQYDMVVLYHVFPGLNNSLLAGCMGWAEVWDDCTCGALACCSNQGI